MIRGSFDVVTSTEALGWAFAPGQPEPVLVQAVLNQEILGEALAERHRPDLAAAGFGNGNAGFSIKFFRPIDPKYLPFISVKVDGGDAELPRAAVLGYKEFFSAVHRARPAAGRHRSLSGGLWTDRTDAAALLQSKMRIGTVRQEVAPVVEKLVHYGLTSLEISPPELTSWRQETAAKAEALVKAGEMAGVLSAVLKDIVLVARADWQSSDEPNYGQPSTRNPSPSPGECLELVLAFDDGVALDVVRASHMLPEFTVTGTSRWVTPAVEQVETAEPMGLLDREALPPGRLTIVGPGTIYRLRCPAGAAALRLMVVPMRGRTVKMEG